MVRELQPVTRATKSELDWRVRTIHAELTHAIRHLTPKQQLDVIDGVLNYTIALRNMHADIFKPRKPRKPKPQPEDIV